MKIDTTHTQTMNGAEPPTAGHAAPAEQVKVAWVPSYDEAADAVEWLSSASFPVERTTIVARDLKLVERVVGIRTRRRAAGGGAATGAAVGAGVGLLLGALTEGASVLGSTFWGAVLGTALGAILAASLHALAARRPFESVSTLDAEAYELLVDEPVVAEAIGVLTEWAVKDPARRLETHLGHSPLAQTGERA